MAQTLNTANRSSKSVASLQGELSLDPRSWIKVSADLGEVHFSIAGFWKKADIENFLSRLDKKSIPIVERGLPIRVIGDMAEFVPQTREVVGSIRAQLMNAVPYGLQRVAIIGASPLVKAQYGRLSKGIDVQFFENKQDGLRWLRSPR